MQTTKHDLSYNEVTLDYQALVQTAEIAFTLARNDVYKYHNQLQEYPLKGSFYISAECLERAAKQLRTAAETLYTLREGLERGILKVVNKPDMLDKEVDSGNTNEQG